MLGKREGGSGTELVPARRSTRTPGSMRSNSYLNYPLMPNVLRRTFPLFQYTFGGRRINLVTYNNIGTRVDVQRDRATFQPSDLQRWSRVMIEERENTRVRLRTRMDELMRQTTGFSAPRQVIFNPSQNQGGSAPISYSDFIGGFFQTIQNFLKRTLYVLPQSIQQRGSTSRRLTVKFPIHNFQASVSREGAVTMDASIDALERLFHSAFVALSEELGTSFYIKIIPIFYIESSRKTFYLFDPLSKGYDPAPMLFGHNTERLVRIHGRNAEGIYTFYRSALGFVYDVLNESYDPEFDPLFMRMECESLNITFTLTLPVAFSRLGEFLDRIQTRITNIPLQRNILSIPELFKDTYVVGKEQKGKQFECFDRFTRLMIKFAKEKFTTITEDLGIKLVQQVGKTNYVWREYLKKKEEVLLQCNTGTSTMESGSFSILKFLEEQCETRIHHLILTYSPDGHPEDLIFPEVENLPEVEPLALLFYYYEGEKPVGHIEFSLTSYIDTIKQRLLTMKNMKSFALILPKSIITRPVYYGEEISRYAPGFTVAAYSSDQAFNAFWKMMRHKQALLHGTVYSHCFEAYKGKTAHKKMEEFYWDIETMSLGVRDPFLSVLITQNERHIFRGKDCVKETLAFLEARILENKENIVVWTYNGSRFDNIYLLPHLRNHEIMGTKTRPKIISESFYFPNPDPKRQLPIRKALKFVDFCLTIGGGLQKAYNEIVRGELSKSVYDVDASKFTEEYISDPIKLDKITQYCVNDCLMLAETVCTFRSQLLRQNEELIILKVFGSASSLAWDIFAFNYLPKTWKDKFIPTNLMRFFHDIVRESYAGGYTQCFEKLMGNGYYYDINSSYPSVMMENVPYKFFDPQFEKCEEDEIVAYLVYLDEWEFPADYMFPNITQKTSQGNFYTTKGGDCWIWDHLLHWNIANVPGFKYQENHLKRIHFKCGPIFQDFINNFYKMKATSTGACKIFAKLMLNSLYGKCGEKEHEKIYVVRTGGQESSASLKVKALLEEGHYYLGDEEPLGEEDDQYTILKLKPHELKDQDGPGGLIHIASWITSKARLKLFDCIRVVTQELKGKVFYCDTDSIFTNVPLPSNYLHETDLGKWKLEFAVKEGRFWGSKMYSVFDGMGEVHSHIKGVGKKYLKEMEKKLWELPIDIQEWNDEQIESFNVDVTFDCKWGYVLNKPFIKRVQQTCGRRRHFTGVTSRPWRTVTKNGDLTGYIPRE